MEPSSPTPVLESGRTFSGAGGSPSFRALLPREHGLIAWVVQPLWLSWLLSPDRRWASVAVLAMVAGFGAFNAIRAGRPRVALGAGGVAAVLLLTGLCGSAQRWPWWVIAAAGAMVLVVGGTRRQLPRRFSFEVAGLAVLCGGGVLVATIGGAAPRQVIAASVVLLAWEVIGLCWVRGQLARVLPRRDPVPHAAFVAFAATMTAACTSVGLGHPAFALVPLLYGLRVLVHAPAARALDAKRVGLTELAWGLTAALVLAIR